MSVQEVLQSPPYLETISLYEGVGGWLAFLVFYLLFLLPVALCLKALQILWHSDGTRAMLERGLAFNLVYWIACISTTALGIYAGIALLNIFPNAVAATKRFLIACLIAGTVIAILTDHTWQALMSDALSALIFPSIWYIYLNRSKRVANTYRNQTASFSS